MLLSSFVVTSTSDSGAVAGTLRWAIQQVDADTGAGTDTIDFDIPATDPGHSTTTGAWTIAPASALPTLTHPAIIDGYSQPGAAPNTLVQGDNAVILIDLSGVHVPTADGLLVNAGGSTVRGLAIGGFANGIHLQRDTGDTITGNFLGTSVNGAAAQGNGGAGLWLDGAKGAVIGGTTPDARNIIAANAQKNPFNGGNLLLNNGASGDLVEGNFIGTSKAGTTALRGLSSTGSGVVLLSAPGNTIGGAAAGAGNVISGNPQFGIQLADQSGSKFNSDGTVIQGNFIGTDASGTRALGNRSTGLTMLGTTFSDATNDTIAGNVIAANQLGVFISNASHNLIHGNFIGTDATGTRPLGNFSHGISLGASGFDTITDNVISANGGSGLAANSQTDGSNTIQGNFIGTDTTGTQPLGNAGIGIHVSFERNDTIGGTAAGAGNVIAANGQDGIKVDGIFASGNVIAGNFIGTDPSGTLALGNGGNGVSVLVSNNTVGGTAAGAGNTIAFNKGAGVAVSGGTTTTGVAILSNAIFSNGDLGIRLAPDTNNSQAAPALIGAVSYQESTFIAGTLASAPNTAYTLQFFANAVADPSGYGEGQTYLGSYTVTTDASGNASFVASFPTVVPAGQAASATATDPKGNTSEFAADVTAFATSTPVVAGGDAYNDDENYTLTVPAPGVLGNDFDVDGDALAAVLVGAPAHGSVTLNADGSFTYTPAAGYLGPDSFTYQATDGTNLSDVTTVAISVNPKTYVVTSTADSGDGSLRWAIARANLANSPAPDTIDFNIPTTDPGYSASTGAWTIQPGTALPTLTHPTVFDGYSQPGAAPNTAAQGDNAVILINLSGAHAPTADGLTFTAGGSTVRGLAINGFTNGIHLQGSAGDTIAGNFLGPDVTGTKGQGNINSGLWLDGASDATVGGTTPDARNIIAASSQGESVDPANLLLSNGASNDVVQGNYIGTDSTGTVALRGAGGFCNGVLVVSAPGNTIGGAAAGAGNVISGNALNGIEVTTLWGSPFNSDGTVIQNNFIGTDVTGTQPLGNGDDGLTIAGSSSGGLAGDTVAGNVISANAVGISIGGTNNVIQGNRIGTDITGTRRLGNAGDGIRMSDSDDTITGNVISANGGDGLLAMSETGGFNTIQGNFIGTDSTGTQPLGNAGIGIDLYDERGNTVGGTGGGDGNVIAANGQDGIRLFDVFASNNVIAGNFIGTDPSGTLALGNGRNGVWALVSNNTIGGTAAGAGNTIAFNAGAGVAVSNGIDTATTGIAILSNAIFSNGDLGIVLNGTANKGQAAPVLLSSASLGSQTAIKGTLSAAANTTYTVQFFANAAPDPSGYGQGQALIGTVPVTTDGNGHADFQFSFHLAPGSAAYIAATATDPADNTSEFSDDVPVAQASQPLVAEDDSYNTDENYPLTVSAPGLTTNDIDLKNGSYIAVLVSAPAHGSVTLNGDGSFTYTPAAGYVGADSFTYEDRATNPAGKPGAPSNPGTVTISVNPKTYVVTSTADSGAGSLRAAIAGANVANSPAPDTIDFNIPTTDPGYSASNGAWTIQPAAALPALAHPTVIDGYSQPGAAPNTVAQGDNAVILVDLSGTHVPTADGLLVTAGGSTVQGLAIGGFANGIHLQGGTGDTIAGDFLGTDVTGSRAQGNSNSGVWLDGASGSTVGSTTPDARNIIAANGPGNSRDGSNVLLGNGASGDVVQGNYIGTDSTGTVALRGSSTIGIGVFVQSAPGNTIGGAAAGAGNVISGNASNGVEVTDLEGSTFNSDVTVIQDNLIGTDVTGTLPLGNGGEGITIAGSSYEDPANDTVAGNVISANTLGLFVSDATNNVLQGNRIGTDASGTRRLGNVSHGISLSDSGNNTIAGNVISANGGDAILARSEIDGSNTIQGNFLGTDVTGTQPLGNAGIGIDVSYSPKNTIGGTAPGAGNVIAANGQDGIKVEGIFASGNVIAGNFIGTDSSGTLALGNGREGAWVLVSNNTIGGLAPGAGNTIAFNKGAGVAVSNGSSTTSGVTILSNAIFSNGVVGITLNSGTNNNQVAPVLTSAASSSAGTLVQGTLTSTANTTFTIQFFSIVTPDPSGFGQGQVYQGSAPVTTDASGNASISVTLPNAIPAGQYLSATATSAANGATSAFAKDIVVTDPASPAPVTPAAVGSMSVAVAPSSTVSGTVSTTTASLTPMVPAVTAPITTTPPAPSVSSTAVAIPSTSQVDAGDLEVLALDLARHKRRVLMESRSS
jgi:parallel beta-helix repeat protein